MELGDRVGEVFVSAGNHRRDACAPPGPLTSRKIWLKPRPRKKSPPPGSPRRPRRPSLRPRPRSPGKGGWARRWRPCCCWGWPGFSCWPSGPTPALISRGSRPCGTPRRSTTAAGKAGVLVAYCLLGLLGLAAYWAPLMLLGLAWQSHHEGLEDLGWLQTLSGLGVLLASAGLLSLGWGDSTHYSGGYLGSFLAAILLPSLNTVGAALALALVLLISVMGATRLSYVGLMALLGQALQVGLGPGAAAGRRVAGGAPVPPPAANRRAPDRHPDRERAGSPGADALGGDGSHPGAGGRRPQIPPGRARPRGLYPAGPGPVGRLAALEPPGAGKRHAGPGREAGEHPAPFRGGGPGHRHHDRTGGEPLRIRAGPGGQDQQDHRAGRRPGPGPEGPVHPHRGPGAGQGGAGHRGAQPQAPGGGPPGDFGRRGLPEVRLPPDPGPGQRHHGPLGGHRPGQDAPPAHRRGHRQRQERRPQRHDPEHPLQGHPGRGALPDGGPQAHRAVHVRRHSPPAPPGGVQPQGGHHRPALGRGGDGTPLRLL